MSTLTKFLGRFKKDNTDILKQLLMDSSLRESLLGVERPRPINDEKTKSDASKVISYARSEDYAVYAQELWKTVTLYVRYLTDDKLSPDQAAFYRGCLSATLDDLRISYKAFQYKESLERKPPAIREIRPPLGV